MNIDWDAQKYTRDFSFVHERGSAVMDLIEADRNSKALDLGCGNGALSKALADKGFKVTGMDASRELLEVARASHPGIEFIEGDATDFEFREPFDVVLSNAVFHWIDDNRQEDMMRCVHKALKPDGEFVFEFGGRGNNLRIHKALARHFEELGLGYRMPFYFPSIGEYAARLENNGFLVKYAILFDRFTELKGEDGLRDWINMFVKAPFSVVKDEGQKNDIVAKAVDELKGELLVDGKWHADYVRLRMKAIRK